jgi:hypothetical protein
MTRDKVGGVDDRGCGEDQNPVLREEVTKREVTEVAGTVRWAWFPRKMARSSKKLDIRAKGPGEVQAAA